jgi:hypothetical protein
MCTECIIRGRTAIFAAPAHDLFIHLLLAQALKAGPDNIQKWDDGHHRMTCLSPRVKFGANMGEVIQFVPKSERERVRLIREARAIYDSIFPPADPISEQRDGALSDYDQRH